MLLKNKIRQDHDYLLNREAKVHSILSVIFQWNWGTRCCHQLQVRCSQESLFESTSRYRSSTRTSGSCVQG